MGIINSSNHPVLVKRVGIHAWSLRSEIEYAVRERYEESVANGTEPYIQDLQDYYSPKNAYDPSNLTAQGLDSCGNPLDEDAAAMLAAIQGGDEEGQEENKEEEKPEENKEEEKAEEADADAEAMAKEMLAGQVADDDAEAMAAQMLADQGMGDAAPKEVRTAENYQRKSPGIEAISPGFCLIADLNMESILFFSYNTFLEGQTIALEFQIPKKFIITCEVIKSTDIDRTSKIISDSKPRYRINAKIIFHYAGERSSLREFLKSVEPDIPPPTSKLKRKNKDEDADEFEDLGF